MVAYWKILLHCLLSSNNDVENMLFLSLCKWTLTHFVILPVFNGLNFIVMSDFIKYWWCWACCDSHSLMLAFSLLFICQNCFTFIYYFLTFWDPYNMHPNTSISIIYSYFEKYSAESFSGFVFFCFVCQLYHFSIHPIYWVFSLTSITFFV